MSLLPALLFAAGAPAIGQAPAITIDPCVEVDPEEVRRLAAMELRTWRFRTSPEAFEVLAACQEGIQQLRLTNRASGQVTVRSFDLSAPSDDDQDAKARELALAIAELLRRADMDSAAQEPAAPSAPTPPPPATTPLAPATAPEPWNLELGVAAVGAGFRGGEVLFGVDVSGRAHLGRWLIAELRLGGRKSRPVDLANGSIDGRGVAAALGLSFDATPGVRAAGVSFGGRLGIDWLRYAAIDPASVPYDGADVTAVNVTGTTTGYVAIDGALCLTVDAAVGGALHSVVIREHEQSLSSMRGILLSGAIGLAGHF